MTGRPLSEQPLPSSFDEDEIVQQPVLHRLVNKLKGEPLIPLGCGLTVAALVGAARAMRRGDQRQMQRMFRARVAAQGFTILAMVGGGLYLGQERSQERELWKVQQAQKDEEKRLRWIRELEVRDAEDQALQERLAERREQRLAKKAAATVAATSRTDATTDENKISSKSSVLASLSGGWLGGGGAEKGKSTADERSLADTTAADQRNNAKGTTSLSVLGDMYGKKVDDRGEK